MKPNHLKIKNKITVRLKILLDIHLLKKDMDMNNNLKVKR